MKVGRKKIYIIRRKIHGKSIMHTVGSFASFNDIKNALEKDKVNLTCAVTLSILGGLGQMLGTYVRAGLDRLSSEQAGSASAM